MLDCWTFRFFAVSLTPVNAKLRSTLQASGRVTLHQDLAPFNPDRAVEESYREVENHIARTTSAELSSVCNDASVTPMHLSTAPSLLRALAPSMRMPARPQTRTVMLLHAAPILESTSRSIRRGLCGLLCFCQLPNKRRGFGSNRRGFGNMWPRAPI